MKQYFKMMMLALASVLMVLPLSAQQRIVKGTVTDDTGEPVAGASVMVAGTSRGVSTDLDGNFDIEAAAGETLVVSFIGFEDAKVKASSAVMNVVLYPDSELLEETVVVGYGVQKKATLTGAVSAVTNSEMAVTKNENVVNMLTGKIPGVRISQRSAQPGEFDNAIDIRGMGGTPLIVVDGIPRDQAYFSRMDANEIESVSVLKDASAAIYGVRAANGVILVTTKHGSDGEGKFDITFSANYGIQSFLYIPETASATDHMLLMNEKVRNAWGDAAYLGSVTPKYTWEQIFEYSAARNRGTNWTEELFNDTVPQSQYNVSLNGGNDRVTYFFNLGYMDQMGAYKSGSLNYNRWNFRSNVDVKITERLRASVQLSGYMDEKNQPFTDIWAVYKKAWTYKPTAEAYVDGNHDYPAYTSEFLESENPVAAIDSDLTGYRQEKRQNLNGSLALTWDIPGVKGLNVKGFYSYDYYTTNNKEYKRTYNLYNRLPDGTMESFVRNSDSYLRRSTDPNYGTVMQLSINYANKFGDHSVNAMALYEEQYNSWDNFYAQRVMLLDGEYLIYGEDEEQVGSMSGAGDKSRRAFVGRVNYDYKGKYMVDLSFRADASSSFPKNSRWGFFPAVSAGWRISEEPWVKDNVDFITNLKLRASYGVMGDDGGASTYPQTVVAYNINKDQIGYFFNGVYMAGVSATSIPNPNLTWYTATTYNVGLDMDLWRGKLTGTFEFFRRDRSGLFATSSAVVPDIVGASLPLENIESDMTYGWEISLGHRNRINDFTYYVNGQISAAKSRFGYRIKGEYTNSMAEWRDTGSSGRNKDIWMSVEEGGRFSGWNEIRYSETPTGQGTLPGDYWYEDWNGDGVINGDDAHPVATYNLPIFNYGISLGLEWKNIDLSMNWQGCAGVYSAYNEVFTEVGPFNGGAALDMYNDRWHTAVAGADPWNPATEWVEGLYPATGHSFNSWATGIKNASYIRLKTLELGYTFPRRWMRKAKIQDLRLYVNGYNLLTFTGLDNIDPERPGASGGASNSSIAFYNYPVNRVFNFGATIKF